MAVAITKWIDRKFYKNYGDSWDNDIFRKLVLKHLTNDSIYLDLGAGRGYLMHMNFKGLCKEAYGVDPGEAVHENPFLDKAFVGLGNNMPFFEDNKFDVIASNNVLEHLADPRSFFNEVKRVLKPNGIFIAKTPNKYHYLMLLSKYSPTKLHKLYNKLRGRPMEDTFETYYRINTKKAIEKMAQDESLVVEELFVLEGRPEYLRINPVTYVFGLLYERAVNLFEIESMKIVILMALRKMK
jgi:SAM-dependent methyltransferase